MHKNTERQWSGKSRGGRGGYMFFVYIIRTFGVGLAYLFLAFVVIHFIPFAPKSTLSVWHYNRKRLGYGFLKSVFNVYRHYFVFGQTLIDRIALKAGLTSKYKFEFENYERFLEIINASHGVVMIGAHVGCWEAGASFFGKYGKKINIVMFDTEHRQIKDVVENNSCEHNYKIIPVNNGSIEALVQIKLSLNKGEYVCFNGDRFIDKNTSEEMYFMGGRAFFPVGPFKIASKCRVPVVFYYSMREKGRKYRFIFKEADIAGKVSYTDLMKQYINSLESIVNKYPQQWFNFYRFWEE